MYLLRSGGCGLWRCRACRRHVLGLLAGLLLLSLGSLVQGGFAWRLLAAPVMQSGDESEPPAAESAAEDAAEPPRLLISEVMVAPLAVVDKQGEWC